MHTSKMMIALLLVLCGLHSAVSQPYLPGQNLLPKGNLLTVDSGGPYNLTLLDTSINNVKGEIAAKGNYTDKDLIDFLVNVECLEGLFDTWGAFGRGFLGGLELGGPTPLGARKANLSAAALPYAEEVALNEQGHALFTRNAGGSNPCPLIDFDGGFNKFFGAAYNLTGDQTIQSKYGSAFDPFANDVNFFLSMLSLEELGATGNKGLINLFTSPVLSDAVAGLATSATGQATIQRVFLWQNRDVVVQPFGETVQQVFARISALRDSLDGPSFDDQGLINTDPRYIAVPASYIDMVPTNIRGLTFSRSPQQNLNILFLGNASGVGVFFPNGILGKLTKPTGYADMASGLDAVPSNVAKASQQDAIYATLPPSNPTSVTGEYDLTQSTVGPLVDATATNRGLTQPTSSSGEVFSGPAPPVAVGQFGR